MREFFAQSITGVKLMVDGKWITDDGGWGMDDSGQQIEFKIFLLINSMFIPIIVLEIKFIA